MTGTATIQNLTISDSTIGDSSNSSLLGAFVGRIKDSTTLINCHTTDTVTVSGGAVGGLVGGRLFRRVSVTWLRGLFAAFLLYGGVRYIL